MLSPSLIKVFETTYQFYIFRNNSFLEKQVIMLILFINVTFFFNNNFPVLQHLQIIFFFPYKTIIYLHSFHFMPQLITILKLFYQNITHIYIKNKLECHLQMFKFHDFINKKKKIHD